MIQIYRKLLSIYKEKFPDSTEEFKKGFWACTVMLQKEIKTSTRYNLQVKAHEDSITIKKLTKEVNHLRHVVEVHKQKLKFKELVSITPIDEFKSFELETTKGDFKIVINASAETLMVIWFKFLEDVKYNSSDECKSKFLNYLIKFKAKGFRAFKDLKTAKKEIGYDYKSRQT